MMETPTPEDKVVSQLVTWLHVYRRALEKIHSEANHVEVMDERIAKIAGQALCLGPDADKLACVHSMEDAHAITRVSFPGVRAHEEKDQNEHR
jgi:hypothetical protein